MLKLLSDEDKAGGSGARSSASSAPLLHNSASSSSSDAESSECDGEVGRVASAGGLQQTAERAALPTPPSSANESSDSEGHDGEVGSVGLAGGLQQTAKRTALPTPPSSNAECTDSDDEIKLPRTFSTESGHRQHISNHTFPLNACVARPVNAKEVARTPKAQEALQKEWDRLRGMRCWDESQVREWSDVSRECKRTGEKAHVGRVFAICVEKNAELPTDHPNRKFKGRVVFQGNNVKDENWDVALFQELSSCPATMEAAKAADCYGLFPGHAVEQADAEQAYTQAKLGGTPTWVRLPPDARPAAWAGMRDPVCPMRLALYGHPDSGGFWEKHCTAHLLKQGFVEIDEWRSCFFHEQLQVYLVVYVDDFKVAGPVASLPKAWKLIRSGLKLGATEPAGHYLGCKHIVSERVHKASGRTVRVMEYDMEDFLKSCVARYTELSGRSDLRRVGTPFLQEEMRCPGDGLGFGDDSWADGGEGGVQHTAVPASAEETSKKKTPKAAKPKSQPIVPGSMAPHASKVLMKVLYAARMARFDLLRAVGHLACYVSK